jgi:hypothetical protein
MGSMSLMHWLVIFFYFAILYLAFGIPTACILGRLGINRWWSALAVVPLANIVGLWVVAFAHWPITDAGQTRPAA